MIPVSQHKLVLGGFLQHPKKDLSFKDLNFKTIFKNKTHQTWTPCITGTLLSPGYLSAQVSS
jgi:hypothetical protein